MFGEIEQTDPPGHSAQRNSASIVDNIGLPISSINIDLQQFRPDRLPGRRHLHQPERRIIIRRPDYVRKLREASAGGFPGATFSFLPADIVSQILNFGSPAPLDVQITGPNEAANQAYALELLRQMRTIPGIADARMQQSTDNPQLRCRRRPLAHGPVRPDRAGRHQRVATALAGTSQTAPTFWLNPKNGVSYPIVAQTPEYQVDTLPDLENLPVTGAAATAGLQVLGGAGHRSAATQSAAVVTHYNIQPVIDLYATTQDRDLGGVAARRPGADQARPRKTLPRGSHRHPARPGRHHEHRLFRPAASACSARSC